MKSVKTFLLGVVLLGLTIGVGAVHGKLIGRWGPAPNVAQGAELLERLPGQIGEWKQAGKDQGIAPEAARMLQCFGNVVRVYENVRTGERVSIAIILGPAGPTSVHTPEICYSSRDYQIRHDREVWSPSGEGEEATDTFWQLLLTKNDVSETPLRVIYGWADHKHWKAAEYPRFEYGGRGYLYKLQLAGPGVVEGSPQDACGEFLTALLPVLRDHMIDR